MQFAHMEKKLQVEKLPWLSLQVCGFIDYDYVCKYDKQSKQCYIYITNNANGEH